MTRKMFLAITCTAIVMASAATTTGVSAANLAERSSGLATFGAAPGFRTRYPATWSHLEQSLQPTIGHYLVYLSNQKMHDPCTTTDDGAGRITESCGLPIGTLKPGGVFVSWASGGVPMSQAALASSLDQAPGRPFSVDGQPGKLSIGVPHGEGCLGATRVMRAAFLADGQFRFQMLACLRGPKLGEHESQVRAMLRATHFGTP
jgi:hypothetical protein